MVLTEAIFEIELDRLAPCSTHTREKKRGKIKEPCSAIPRQCSSAIKLKECLTGDLPLIKLIKEIF